MSSSANLSTTKLMRSLLEKTSEIRERLCDFGIILTNRAHFENITKRRFDSNKLKQVIQILKISRDNIRQDEDIGSIIETVRLHRRVLKYFPDYVELSKHAETLRPILKKVTDVSQLQEDSQLCMQYIQAVDLVDYAFPELINQGFYDYAKRALRQGIQGSSPIFAESKETHKQDEKPSQLFTNYRQLVNSTQDARNVLDSVVDAKELTEFRNAFRYCSAALHVQLTSPEWIKEDYLFQAALRHPRVAIDLFKNGLHKMLSPQLMIRLYVQHANDVTFQESSRQFQQEVHLNRLIERMTGQSLSDGSDNAIAAFLAGCQNGILKSFFNKKPVVDLLRLQMLSQSAPKPSTASARASR